MGNRWMVAIILLAAYFVKAFVLIIPVQTLYIAAGMLFNPLVAIMLTLGGLCIELSINYICGRFGKDTKLFRWLKSKAQASKYFGGDEASTVRLCLLSRLVPNPIPFDVKGIVFGAMGISYWKYLLFSLLGISVTMLPFVLAGGAIANPFSAEFLVPFGISLFVAAGMYGIYYVSEKRRKSADS